MLDFNLATFIGGFLFGLIGMIAVGYGKMRDTWQPKLIGVLLMVFPYAISQVWLMYAIGVALTASLFVFRGD